MRLILSTFLLFGVFSSYGQRQISCVINNTVLFETLLPDQDVFEYVIVDRSTDVIDGINTILMFVVPQRNNLIMSFRGEEREVIYNSKKRRYTFDGGTYKTYPDLLSAVKFFLLTN